MTTVTDIAQRYCTLKTAIKETKVTKKSFI